eukprot:scaffold6554_cov142-Isochrysis_galbana.AAC.4
MSCELEHVVLGAALLARAASSIGVVGGERIEKSRRDGTVGLIRGERVGPCVADCLGQVEIGVGKWLVGNVVGPHRERGGKDKGVEAPSGGQMSRVARDGVEVEEHVVHTPPFSEEHALPEGLATLGDGAFDDAAHPSGHFDDEIEREG